MRVELVWLTVALLSFPLLTLCSPLNVLVAPNLLRVGTPEKVFVEVQDYKGGKVPVRISVKNHPKKTSELTWKSVDLTAENNFQAVVEITIPESEHFNDDPLEKQYVYLQAEFHSKILEKVVLLSFQSGYIFVQTDKTIYTPGTEVLYRIFSMTPDLQPGTKNGGIYVEVLNPQGITINRDTIFPKKGTVKGSYKIPEVATPGIWNLAARFIKTPQKNFTAEFEVKEYVLPSFEVLLNPTKAFFYVDDKDLQVDITAKYLFGENVDGTAFVVFGVKTDDTKYTLPSSLTNTKIVNGEGQAKLTRDMIQNSFPEIDKLVGSSLYISVSVLTESEMVAVEKGGIQIVTSPYTIQFTRTPKFFHPGMSFHVTVYVTNPDQSPAKNVDVLIQPENVRGRTKSNGLAKVLINTQEQQSTLQISAKTTDPDILKERQAENQMTAQAYVSKGGSANYLHLSVHETEVELDEQISINVFFKSSIQDADHDMTYLVLSKGQIVEGNKFVRKKNLQGTLSIKVNRNLVPSFRVVAYYHIGSSEVVSDSIWVDVHDTCMGTLKLNVKESSNSKRIFEPGEGFQLSVTGDPGAKVGLVAVDKAVFVLNNNKLTQKKIWDIIEKHDTGCTAGSGKDSMGVFYDAGLLFQSDLLGGTNERTAPVCPTLLKRKRRADTVMQIKESLMGKYVDEEKKCCADGLKQNRLGYTCERRATFILDGAKCVEAFLDCCRAVQKRKSEQKELLVHARSKDEEEDFVSSEEIVSRTQFPESWLWEDIELPACKGNAPCQTTTYSLPKNYLKDSITTWEIQAISLSETNGICVAEPYEITVAKNFFVDLKLPYSAVRNEQIEIKAILHNFSNKKQRVRVEFFETENVCSAASKKKKYRTIVNINEMSTLSIPYIIIPMEIGDKHIEVQAATSSLNDGVRKILKVVSEGERIELPVQNVELNPSQSGGVQVVNVRSDILQGRIPESPAHTFITVAGQEVSQTIEQAISGDFMGRLIVQPHGCGEQNMIFMTLPLIATHYLDTTNQWDKVGLNRRNEAIKFIQTGYERQLAYRKTDGSYAAWIQTPSSTWLTAYVGKVFALASDLISIKDDVLCSAIKWLILHAQMPDGSFKENAPVYHAEMVGDVRGKDADASLTAFVLIALQEAEHLCDASVRSLPESSSKAIRYLENRFPTLTNPYAIAMSSYALANAGKFNKQRLLQSSSDDGTFWQAAGGHHSSLEATAYALLALVKAKEFDVAGKAVHWLNRQSSPYGGHGTTQATIIVFQAVAEYYKQVRDRQNTELNVELSVSGRSQLINWSFNKNTAFLTRSEKVQLKQDFNVTAKGTGAGVLKVLTIYYAKPIEKKNDCQNFDLSVQMTRELEGKGESYEIAIDILFKNPTRDATMTILDIGLLTGFAVEGHDLNNLINGKDKYIQRFEIDKQLSERGSLILYLFKVSHTLPDRIAFKVNKINDVAWLQPAAVRVYEYYSPEKQCVKFYHPLKEDGSLNRLCIEQKDLCQCAEENCSIQKKKGISENDRDKKACDVGLDYVYKIKFLNVERKQNTDYYEMMIEEVLKEGTDHGVLGGRRSFIGHAVCNTFFGFEEGKSYLIMGQSADLPRIDGELQYILGEQTWIEYWPTDEEGQTPEFRDSYEGISKLSHMLSEFGCTT